jgi:tetratricopeptide (TPR) repeat protein
VDEKPLLIDLRGAGDIYLRGEPLRITNKKARTIVSMLALVPRHRRSRSWIWGKLWSERGEQQAAASLRQALHILRDHFQLLPGVLLTTHEYVGLEPDLIEIIYPEPGETLLAGLDIPDRGFEDWLEDQRHSFDVNAVSLSEGQTRRKISNEDSRGTIGIGILNSIAVCETNQALVMGDIISDLLGREMHNFGIAEIFDYRHRTITDGQKITQPTGAVDCFMQVTLQNIGNSHIVNCRFSDSLDCKQLWAGFCKITANPDFIESIEFKRFVNEIVDAIMFIHDSPEFSAHSEMRTSSKLALAGINETLKGRHGNLKLAEQLLTRAYSMDQRSVYLGWQTHIVAYLLGERLADDSDEYRRHLAETIAIAEEKGRFNPVTLALIAHTYSFVFRDYEKATVIFDRMFQLNPMQAICYDLAAVTNVYVNNAELAYEQSSLALKLGQFSQYNYCTYTTHTMSCFMSGRSDEAIQYGYRGIEMKPTFTANLRYLIAALVRIDDMARALEVFEMLVKIEPDVILIPFENESYPIAGISRDSVTDCLALVARHHLSMHA